MRAACGAFRPGAPAGRGATPRRAAGRPLALAAEMLCPGGSSARAEPGPEIPRAPACRLRNRSSITYTRFVLHDAWAIASHIALSVLMSFFPFLILLTALASFFGSGSLADRPPTSSWRPGRARSAGRSPTRSIRCSPGGAATSSPSGWCSRSTSRRAASRACGSGSTAPTACARPAPGGSRGSNRSPS